MKKTTTLLLLALPMFLWAQPKIQLTNFAGGFTAPVDLAHCGDSRLFVVERRGIIWGLDSLGNKIDTFLNIISRINSGQSEQGLLGLAFHPNYAENGYFYVNYIKNNGDTRIARFSVKPNNPNEADPNSELTILEQDQPTWNHNGGCLKFGPDGYLYAGLGDGGYGGDPQGNGQNTQTFLGKILRIDVNNSTPAQPYAIPADNPFINTPNYFPEIWSLGWRNPWRFSFDRLTGDMWIADVGQNIYEEVNFEPANTPGLNYGWRCYEGLHPYSLGGCLPEDQYTFPFFEYQHNNTNGCSVTGGFIYRGSKYPDLYGYYLFADYCTGRIWYSKRNADGSFTTNALGTFGVYEFSSFGEDANGELYAVFLSSGKVQKIKELCSNFSVVTENIIDYSCKDGFSGLIDLGTSGATGNVSYTWSNGQTTDLIVYLNPGIYTVAVKDGNNCVRNDTFEITRVGYDAPVLTASDTVICPNSPVVLTASHLPDPHTVLWYNGPILVESISGIDTVSTLTVTQAGDYQAILVDSFCIPSSSVIHIVEAAVVIPELVIVGDTIFSNQECGQCQWLQDGQALAGAGESYLVPDGSGTFELVVTTPEGCVVSSGGVNFIKTDTRIPAHFKRFALSPNPTSAQVRLEIDLDQPLALHITLSNNLQQQLIEKRVEGAHINTQFDLSRLPAGTYFLTINSGKDRFVRTVVKK